MFIFCVRVILSKYYLNTNNYLIYHIHTFKLFQVKKEEEKYLNKIKNELIRNFSLRIMNRFCSFPFWRLKIVIILSESHHFLSSFPFSTNYLNFTWIFLWVAIYHPLSHSSFTHCSIIWCYHNKWIYIEQDSNNKK